MNERKQSPSELRQALADLRDRITEQEADRGASRLEAIAMMAGGFTHEINNLMAGVLGNVALLRTQLEPGHPGHARLDAIDAAAEKSGMLSRRMIAFAQGKAREPEPVNLNSIVYHVLLVEEQRLAPRIRIVRYIDPDLWRVSADQTQMAQVVLNLAVNAVEAIRDQGRVVISTRNVELREDTIPSRSELLPGRHVMLTVEDNGCGMSPDMVARVFDVDYSTKSPKRGLGLATVLTIVRANGGHVSITSKEGEGTAIRVFLPAIESVFEAPPRPVSELPKGGETVLIADDERMLLDVIVETLSRLGYRVLAANNGQEAIDIARRHEGTIHVCLLDMAMPVMGGAEAFPLLKKMRPDMKIIICTGFEEELVSHTLLGAGVSSILLKPFRPANLAQEIRKVLEQGAVAK